MTWLQGRLLHRMMMGSGYYLQPYKMVPFLSFSIPRGELGVLRGSSDPVSSEGPSDLGVMASQEHR